MSFAVNSLSPIQLAYVAKSLRKQPSVREPIAIVGSGCRFPGGVNSADSYWQLLVEGKNGIVEIPESRWNIERYFSADKSIPGKMYSRFGGFIEAPEAFDADFFNIPKREAISVDPQHRLLLETSWEALENAGYSPQRLSGVACGVFVGMFGNDYMVELMSQPEEHIDAYMGIGNYHSMAAGRLAYLLGVQGPSVAVDAACASSLVSVHLACQSLRAKESDLALAGGTHCILSPEFSISFCKAHMLSATSRCMAFDDRADGFVRGEGAGMVVLKRLSDAIADRDNILALIRGSAVNQDGATSSLTVPSGLAQQRVIRAALNNAHVEPEQVGYVETHGTGTPIGDPIEFGALCEVYGKTRSSASPLLIGAVKTNVGHLEGAAGIAGLIKTALILHHKMIPPTLYFAKPNRHIDWDSGKITVNTKPHSWEGNDSRFAGVSAFGLNGTNVHVILQEAPTLPARATVDTPSRFQILSLSAKSDIALKKLARRYCDYLRMHPLTSIRDFCFTLNTGRSHMSHRLALVADSTASLIEQLSTAAISTPADRSSPDARGKSNPVFYFADEIADARQLHRQLYNAHVAFRRAVDECIESINQINKDKTDISFEALVSAEVLDTRCKNFIWQYAFARLWLSLNVIPSYIAVCGAGAYPAGCIAAIFSVRDGLLLVQSDTKTTDFSNGYNEVKQCETAAGAAEFDIFLLPEEKGWDSVQTDVFIPCGAGALKHASEETTSAPARGFKHFSDLPGLLHLIARIYTNGTNIDWQVFEENQAKSCTRLRLPTYPFCRSRYWVDNRRRQTGSLQRPSILHPLVHQRRQKQGVTWYDSLFSGKEFVFTDHRVNHQKLLPATGYLEMARAAAELAINNKRESPNGFYTDAKIVVCMRNVVWKRPLAIDACPLTVSIALNSDAEQMKPWGFSVFSEAAFPEQGPLSVKRDAPLLHALGNLYLGDEYPQPPPAIDIDSVRTSLQQHPLYKRLDRWSCRQWYADRKVQYGLRFQALAEVHVNGERTLGRLDFPGDAADLKDYVLHPGLLDSALQIVAAFPTPDATELYLPTALKEIHLYGPLTDKGYVFAERITATLGSDQRGYDFTITDHKGRVTARLHQLIVKRINTINGEPAKAVESIPALVTDRVQYYAPRWLRQARARADAGQPLPASVLLFDQHDDLRKALATRLGHQNIIRVECADGFGRVNPCLFSINPQRPQDYADLFKTLKQEKFDFSTMIYRPLPCAGNRQPVDYADFHSLVNLSQALTIIARGAPNRLTYLLQHKADDTVVEQSALTALFKTQNKEDIRRCWQLLEITAPCASDESTRAQIMAEGVSREWAQAAVPFHVYYDAKDDRHVAQYQPVDHNHNPCALKPVIQRESVVVIAGGNGGLARVFADHLCQRYHCRVVLLGRSPASAEVNTAIKAIHSSRTGTLEYIQADVCDLKQMHSVFKRIRDSYGAVHGIIHSAAVIKDSLLVNKTVREIASVLSPKYQGARHLDEVTQTDALDFFVLFSSLASVMGNVGQTDYAYANCLLDHFAGWRQHQLKHHRRKGVTVSINWPAWPLGLGIDQSVAERLRMETGMTVLAVEEGIRAFEWALTQSGEYQLLVFSGDSDIFSTHVNRSQLYHHATSEALRTSPIPPSGNAGLSGSQSADPPCSASNTDVTDRESLRPVIEGYVFLLFANLLKISSDDIDLDATWDSYHIDSITMMDLTYALEKKLGPLPKTLLFEYSNFNQLIDYLYKQHSRKFMSDLYTASTSMMQKQAAEKPITEKQMVVPVQTALPAGELIKDKSRFKPIAIIGMSGQYPMAVNLTEFWQLLRDGQDCITEIPGQRWDHSRYFSHEKGQAGKTYTKWGGFIKNVDQFDPQFFTISPREAELMDPQERLFLQCAHQTLEHAGYTRKSLGGDVGVFVGVMYAEYQLYGPQADFQGKPVALNGSSASVANRVSFYGGFHGPSMALDTMCSSSLTAVHLACQSLHAGECQYAIAGGANLSLHPNKYLLLGQGQFAASDGRCKSFGEGGDGYVPGEGIGALLLKRLDDAEREGDAILGVIKGTAVNHGGKASGYTVPHPKAQARVIAEALSRAGVDARTISYLEAHGTGTSLGDPIEIAGLSMAFQEQTSDKQFCAIGSVKSNIGHCESASGVASITKVLLQLQHRQLAPSLHAQKTNPQIDFADTPFVVQKQLAPWLRPVLEVNGRLLEYPRRAGISSFGAGGANAHIIIEEWQGNEAGAAPLPAHQDNPPAGRPRAFVFSAKTRERLQRVAEQFSAYVHEHAQKLNRQLDNIAYTLQVGREAMSDRLAIIAGSTEELGEKLAAFVKASQAGQTQTCPQGVFVTGSGDKENSDNKDKKETQVEADNLADTLQHWVQGNVVDWRPHRLPITHKRVHLPGYPFLNQRYWVDVNPVVGSAPGRGGLPQLQGSDEHAELHCFAESWQASSLPPSSCGVGNIFICFLSQSDHQAQLAAAIRTRMTQAEIIFIVEKTTMQRSPAASPSGKSGFEASSAEESTPLIYSIDAESAQSYVRAFQAIKQQGKRVDGIFYLWALENRRYMQDSAPVVYLLQALNSVQLPASRCLLAAQYEAGISRCYLESWIGFARSLERILPSTSLACLFIEPSLSEKIDLTQFARKLLDEYAAPRLQSTLYRRGIRHCYQIEKQHAIELDPADHAVNNTFPAESSAIKSGGTYLITGGLGELGFVFARYLATFGAKLILSGRSRIDDKKQQRLQALQKLGAQTIYIQADVSDKAAMQSGLGQAKDNFGQINGVLHAAGAMDNRSLFSKNAHEAQRILAPKITGTIILDELLAGEELDFTCYFSSLSAILGDFGSCDYAVANRFQMAYADYRNQHSAHGRYLAINWPLWKDGGIKFAEQQQTLFYLKSSGQYLLTAEEGTACFEQLLKRAGGNYLILKGQRENIYRLLDLDTTPATNTRIVTPSPAIEKSLSLQTLEAGLPQETKTAGRRTELNGLSLSECIARDIKKHITRILKLPNDQQAINENFADFGFESISLAQLAKALSAQYQLTVTPSLFFDYPTIGKLTEYLLQSHREHLNAIYFATDKEISVAKAAHNRIQAAAATSISTPSATAPVDSLSSASAATLSHIAPNEPVAIIGMSGRFAQARDIHEMWQLLAEGKDAVSEISGERFDWRPYYSESAEAAGTGRICSKWCGTIPCVKEFDPLFFEITPHAAKMMDPRQRLLLQESFNALEDAGYGTTQLQAGKVGMFVGVEQGDYQQLLKDHSNVTANHDGVLAARLAYFLNLSGPVMALNTACSSGLLALHQACSSLRLGECDTALAAAANLILTPDAYISLTQAGLLSPEGKCFAFDRRANGMVPGEAVVAITLKTLARAERDGDPIYAVIRASGVNYDGKTNGMTAPSGAAQRQLITEVYKKGAVNVDDIDYVIAHGTGTALGDSVEVNALNEIFKKGSGRCGYCALTSTKTNFGHTFAASGLVSLVSLVQAISHKTIPASLHFAQNNDYIDWNHSPFYVNTAARPWPSPVSGKRIGALSAFGMSGTNVHALVEEYLPQARNMTPEIAAPCYLLAFSAKTDSALVDKVQQALRYLEQYPDVHLTDLAYTLLHGRQHFSYRYAIVVDDRKNAIDCLRPLNGSDRQRPGLFTGKIARDFTEQSVIRDFAQALIVKLAGLLQDPEQYRQTLFALAAFYSQGYDLDWSSWCAAMQPRRIHTPTYPFARENYWVSPEITPAANFQPADSQYAQQTAATQTMDPMSIPAPHPDDAQAPGSSDVLVYEPFLRQTLLQPKRRTSQSADGDHYLLISDTVAVDKANLVKANSLFTTDKIRQLQSGHDAFDLRFQDYAVQTLAVVKSICESHNDEKCPQVTVQLVVPTDDDGHMMSALAGLLRCAQLENPGLYYQVIETDAVATTDLLAEQLVENLQHLNDLHIVYQEGRRYVTGWRELPVSRQISAHTPWKQGGVYLLTGGMGAIGQQIVYDIVDRLGDVTLVLLGRTQLTRAQESRLSDLRGKGARIQYHQLDISNRQALIKLIKNIQQNSDALNGIIHCAGVIRDNLIINKSEDELRDVMAPKVSGVLNLDNATQAIDLDFFVLFSSIAGALGNTGQADYAAANAFLDRFAVYRNRLVEKGQRRGKTLTINWPLWRNSGMAAGTAIQEQWKSHGINLLDSGSGLRILSWAIADQAEHLLVVAGQGKRLRTWFPHMPQRAASPLSLPQLSMETPPSPELPDKVNIESPDIEKKCLRQLIRLFGEVTGLAVEQIDCDAMLESYGIDSMLIIRINRRLAEHFPQVPQTLFYEYKTLRSAAQYLCRKWPDACMRWIRPTAATQTRAKAAASVSTNNNSLDDKKNEYKPPDRSRGIRREIHVASRGKAQDGIAIIGFSCQFPQAESLTQYWENLHQGRTCFCEIPQKRWTLNGFYEAEMTSAINNAKSYCRLGGFIDSFDQFDPLFFNLSPVDVYNLDPQERLILTNSWQAMEDSGYCRQILQDRYAGSVGVFIGVTKHGFDFNACRRGEGDVYLPQTSFSSMANRVSYQLDLRGPSMAIDTMCASSLTALHEACEHIYRKDCHMAIAGAVNLYLHPRTYIDLCRKKLLTNREYIDCFSETGTGFIPGEGVAVAVLKPLSAALDSGDHIYGVIKSSCVMHCGHTHSYSAPDVAQHRKLIEKTMQRADCSAEMIEMVEAAANGSSMGDAIELRALSQVFRSCPLQSRYLSTVKPNIGHLEAASGFSQLAKVLCQFQHRTLAPTLLYSSNEQSAQQWRQSPFYVLNHAKTWPPDEDFPWRCLITSFGAGGASAALVIEAFTAEEKAKTSARKFLEQEKNTPYLFLLSARTKPQLARQVSRLSSHLKQGRNDLASVAYTLQLGRHAMRFRLAIIADNKAQLLDRLDAYQWRDNNHSAVVIMGKKDYLPKLKKTLPLAKIQGHVVEMLTSNDLVALAKLWTQGVDEIDWRALYKHPVQRCQLPTYAFKQRGFWYSGSAEPESNHELPDQAMSKAPALQTDHTINQSATIATAESIQTLLLTEIKAILLFDENDELSVDNNFSDIGLDSITSMRFVQKLSQKLQLPLRETLVFDYPTVADLAAYIAGQLPTDASVTKHISMQPLSGGRALNHADQYVKDAAASQPDGNQVFRRRLKTMIDHHPEVAPLQIEGQGPIVFCIHPMSGDVGVYQKIADAVAARCRVIGLKSRGMQDNAIPLTTIEAMAKHYATIIQQIDGTGPYHLLGASMGGAAAYETARILQQENKPVDTLFLLEAPLITNEADAALWYSDPLRNLLMNANFLLISLLHMDPQFRLRKAAGEIQWSTLEIRESEITAISDDGVLVSLVSLIQSRGVSQSEALLTQRLQAMAAVHQNNLQALRNYRAQPWQFKQGIASVLMRTESAYAVSDKVYNPDYLRKVQQVKGSMAPFLTAWSRLLPHLQTEIIQGENHFEVMSTNSASLRLADSLVDRIRQSQKNSGRSIPLKTALPEPPRAVAIIGMSGCFPGAIDTESFWQLLKAGTSAVSEVPPGRAWTTEDIYDPEPQPNKAYTRYGAFLDEIDYFDPAFFHISPKEAEMMDTSERLFLQESWKAVESAGIDPSRLSGQSWGVFCGGGGDYTLLLKEAIGISPHVTQSGIAGRVAYSLNLKGPVVSVDAACASSLLAVAQACDHILLNKCEAALAGGIMVHNTPNLIIAGCQKQLYSSKSQAAALDENASGMIPGEAVGVLVLKALDKAIDEGDHIYGVIEGWGNNHNGRTNGMAAPSVQSQTELIRDVYQHFDIDPETIDMVEANATATRLGDAVEVEALTEAFRTFTDKTGYCVLGSVENNIGHAFQASAMGHVFKVLLALSHGEIPLTPNIQTVNPAFNLDATPFYIPRQNTPWRMTAQRYPRRAAINSFGSTGSNVHLVIADPPAWIVDKSLPQLTPATVSSDNIICISAKSATALRRRCEDLATFIERQADWDNNKIRQLSASLILRRSHFEHRVCLVIRNVQELVQGLSSVLQGQRPACLFSGVAKKKLRPALQSFGQSQLDRLTAEQWQRETLMVLADLYIQGFHLSMAGCFSSMEKRPMPLPAYPFDKRFCRINIVQADIVPRKGEIVARPALSTSVSLPDTGQVIQSMIARITGYVREEVNSSAPFSHYGIDSLMSMRLLAEVNEHFKLSLSITELAGNNTIDNLVNLITTQYPEGITAANQDLHASVDNASPGMPALAQILPELPGYLHSIGIKADSVANKTISCDWLHSAVAQLITQGIALFHDGVTCYLIAHQSIDIDAALQQLSVDERQFLTSQLPVQRVIAPVSQEQARSLYHSEVMGEYAWNVQHLYQLKLTDINIARLNRAMGYLIDNHDILRSVFFPSGNTWVQVVELKGEASLKRFTAERLTDFQAFIASQRNRLLPLSKLPLLQVWVSEIGTEIYLGFVTHHCLADGFTTTLLFTELMSYYSMLSQASDVNLFPVAEQYWQYSLQQFNDAVYRDSTNITYWSTLMAETDRQAMRLPYAVPPSEGTTRQKQQAAVHLLPVPQDLAQRIDSLTRAHGVTISHLFTTAVAILLTRIYGNNNAVVQFTSNQRDRSSSINTAGDFTNPLFFPLKITISDQLINTVKRIGLENAAHSAHGKIRFPELLTCAGIKGYEDYYSSINDIMINITDIDSATLKTFQSYGRSLYVDLVLQTAANPAAVTELSGVGTLFYQLIRTDAKLHLFIAYRKHLFKHNVIENMGQKILTCLTYIIDFPEHRIQQLLSYLGITRATLPQDLNLSQCQRLNKITAGRPVFWFHGGLGGIESYRIIAAKSTRPFYGIQARGWMTEDEPIRGIETMAAHYISLITSIQPEGPYDFGGFSLGGMIAYEVTRQLQLKGQVVNIIIMVDTLDSKRLAEVDTQSKKTLMLQAANLFLLSTVAMNPALMKDVGITQDDVSFTLNDRHFLRQLAGCAKRRGLKLSEEKITSLIKKTTEVQFAYQLSQFSLQPLPKPDQVHCYYIRNKEGFFLGDLQPYFTGPEDKIPVKVEHYWETWQKLISHFQLMDIDASSHMAILLDTSINDDIACFCEQVYSGSISETPTANDRRTIGHILENP